MQILVLLLGWSIGLLVNYVADILPRNRSLTRPVCIECGNAQSWVNYLFWPRKCPNCSHRRRKRTWLLELILAGITLWYWTIAASNLEFIAGMLILIYFVIVVVIDVEHHLILHPVSLFGGIIGVIVGVWKHGILETVAGGIAGAGVMLILYLLGGLYVRYFVHRNNKEFSEEALGFGDVILGGVLGLLLGWPAIVGSLVLTILLAGFFSLGYILFTTVTRRYQAYQFIPYGPFLIGGAAMLFYFRDIILVFLNQ
jgi:leader peptidase (prepilin peptidase) / N-methyltransferase